MCLLHIFRFFRTAKVILYPVRLSTTKLFRETSALLLGTLLFSKHNKYKRTFDWFVRSRRYENCRRNKRYLRLESRRKYYFFLWNEETMTLVYSMLLSLENKRKRICRPDSKVNDIPKVGIISKFYLLNAGFIILIKFYLLIQKKNFSHFWCDLGL